jgi:hypothetical protein
MHDKTINGVNGSEEAWVTLNIYIYNVFMFMYICMYVTAIGVHSNCTEWC